MNAANVIYEATASAADNPEIGPATLAFVAVDALRAAVGGGPVVILEDGTLATLDPMLNLRSEADMLYDSSGERVLVGPSLLYEIELVGGER